MTVPQCTKQGSLVWKSLFGLDRALTSAPNTFGVNWNRDRARPSRPAVPDLTNALQDERKKLVKNLLRRVEAVSCPQPL